MSPLGSVLEVNLGWGYPVAVTVKLPVTPTVKVAWLAEVKIGVAGTTFNVNSWVAVPTPLFANRSIVYNPVASGVPEITPLEG